jgi:DNA invertase Pin-like site-specific DNA recombinase
MKAFAYLRVSTDRQEVEAQRSQVKAYATYRGFELLDIPDEIDVCGATPFAKRPVGAEILRRLNECDLIIFTKVDRGFRDTVDAILTVDSLRAKGKDVVFLDLGVDTRTVMGRAFFQQTAVWAEAERGRIAERIRERLAEARKRPNWRHGPAPYGFRNLAHLVDGRKVDGGLHEPVGGEESATIENIVRLRREGLPFDAIAAALRNDNVRTRRGGRWAAATVKKIYDRAVSR